MSKKPVEKKKFPERIVSGMRPTGRLHLGHYFGVLVNYLELQKTHDCFFMVADLHALTTGDLAEAKLAERTREMLLDWLAVGVDPDKATIFVQSSVPEHAELYVIFSMLTSVGWLERNPTYKEMREQLGENNTSSYGMLGYPVLQTVDVSIYKGTKVPVGEDQKAHLEMGRELLRRFHHVYKKEIFPEFTPHLTVTPKLLGIDGRKMSKSYGNAIELSEEPAKLRKKVMSMLTDVNRPKREDPGHPEICNVFTFHKLFTPPERVKQIEVDCRSAVLGCGEDKQALAERILEWQAPILKRRNELAADPGYIDEVIRKGNAKAREVAKATMEEVWSAVGTWR